MNEYISKLTAVRNNFNTLLADGLANGKAADNMVAFITARVQRKGLDSNNSKFSKYSNRPLKIYRSMFKTDAAFKTAIKEAVKFRVGNHLGFLLIGGYKRIREIEGLQTGFKDFSFTGKMWQGFAVTGFTKTDKDITFRQSGRDEESQMKIDRNSEREGKSIIAPSKEELKKWADTVQLEVNKLLNIK